MKLMGPNGDLNFSWVPCSGPEAVPKLKVATYIKHICDMGFLGPVFIPRPKPTYYLKHVILDKEESAHITQSPDTHMNAVGLFNLTEWKWSQREHVDMEIGRREVTVCRRLRWARRCSTMGQRVGPVSRSSVPTTRHCASPATLLSLSLLLTPALPVVMKGGAVHPNTTSISLSPYFFRLPTWKPALFRSTIAGLD